MKKDTYIKKYVKKDNDGYYDDCAIASCLNTLNAIRKYDQGSISFTHSKLANIGYQVGYQQIRDALSVIEVTQDV